ncbi:hypothetical protein [Polynucleobacter sinensis]|uniref:hypothetical protein n=1 Tax=Polynucleobacter sinensis TaxID=1743157 RepID=UPI000783BC1D|nr:hypothetical protein [Polynucleobacter sinensis]
MNTQKVVKLPTLEQKAPARRHRPLKTMEQVRQELSKVYRASRDQSIEIGDASKLANILSLIGRVIEGSTVESRIKALEDQRNA